MVPASAAPGFRGAHFGLDVNIGKTSVKSTALVSTCQPSACTSGRSHTESGRYNHLAAREEETPYPM